MSAAPGTLLEELARVQSENRRLRRRLRLVEASREMWRARARGEAWAARQARRRTSAVMKPW